MRCWVVSAMLGCQCDVSAFDLLRSMCRPSKIDVSTFEDQRSMCRPSRIDDRCVDLRRWVIEMPTFEDRWPLCQPSKTDDRCEIMLLYTLAQNIDGIVVSELRRGFALQCFHCSCPVCMCVCVCVSTHICHITHWNHTTEIPTGSQQYSNSFKFCRFS